MELLVMFLLFCVLCPIVCLKDCSQFQAYYSLSGVLGYLVGQGNAGYDCYVIA